jgi:hypothetical protein
LDLVLTVPSYEHLAMDDPGKTAPRDAALPEIRGGNTHLAFDDVSDLYPSVDDHLPLSASKSFIDGPAAASARNRVHYDCGSTLRNPRACLVELPDELLVRIFKFAEDIPYYQNPLISLSRTSKKLKVLADELLYKSIKIKDGSFFPKVLATLKKNAHLAIPVRSMTLEFAANAKDGQLKVHRIPDVVPNIRDLTIKIFGRYGHVISGDSLRALKSKLWDYPTLKELDISVAINLTLFRHFLSLPFLETLKCDLPDSVQSPAPWKPLVPKSNVRNLKIAQLDNFEIISQIVSSVESLKHLGLHHSSSQLLTNCHVSWYTITQSLLTHKDSLESLEIRHNAMIDFRSWGRLQDFSKLQALTLTFPYARLERSEKFSLAGMLPEGLRELSVFAWFCSAFIDGYYEELLSLKEHSHPKLVKIDVWGLLVVPATGLRLSTVVETLQKSGIRVEAWQSGITSLTPVVSSLRDWEDQIEAETRPDACVWDEENEDNKSFRSITPSLTESEKD